MKTAAPLSVSTESLDGLHNIIRDLDALSYEMLDHAKAEDLCEIIGKFQAWLCAVAGHDWVFDMCGYWQHQYCTKCGGSKYPDMAGRKCRDLSAEMGSMTEDEFLAKNINV